MAKSSSVEEWLAQLLPEHRAAASRLRRMVREVDPDLREAMKWGNPVYSLESDVIYIADQRQYVQLGFFAGADMPDPHELIEGTGKGMRHIKGPLPIDESFVIQLRIYVRNAVAAAR